MARRPSYDLLVDMVRDACLERLDAGRPRPSIEELREALWPHFQVDALRMERLVRALIAAGEIPDGGPAPEESTPSAAWRQLYLEHMGRERRIGIGEGP